MSSTLPRGAPEGAWSKRGQGPRTFRLALSILVGGLTAPALAGPRKIDDCEAIKDANAYNLCLASFGPMRGQHGASYPGVASEGEKGGERSGASKAGSSRAGAPGYGRGFHTHGRIRMEFTPGRR